MNRKTAILLLAITATLWSVGGLLIKSVGLSSLAIAGTRSLIGGLTLAVYIRKFKFKFGVAQIGAAISFALTVVLFVSATKLTTAANAILLQYTAPIYAAILGWPLLGEKPKPRDWVTLVVVIFGMLLFFVENVEVEHFWGNVIALLSGLSFAGIPLFLRMDKEASTFEPILMGHILTALIGLPFLLKGPTPTSTDILYLVILGVFQIGISYILYAKAVRYVSALEATLVPVIEPILNPIWVMLFFGEVPSKYAFMGGAVVLTAILVHSVLTVRDRSPDATLEKAR